MDFYEGLSATYDKMTRFESRLDREKVILKTWVDRYNPGSVLDAACGTGLHGIALRKLGIDAVGADISATMIKKAIENAKSNSVDAEFITAGMVDLRDAVETEFDPLIRFNILVIDHGSKPISHRLHTTELYPYTCNELTDALSDMSFTDVEIFGSMNRDEFDPFGSTDLVIAARRE